MLLENKTVIVTGAAGGLGEGIARACHSEGARVVIGDVKKEAAEGVARSLGERALSIPCDVRREQDLEMLVAGAIQAFGRIDGLVNNAGVNFAKPFLETTLEEWDRVQAVDLRAVFLLTKLACSAMLKQSPPGGAIVNIASVHSYAAMAEAAPYDAAKWGVVGFTKSIAVELAPLGIRANAISPGLLNTPMWKVLRDAAPDARACDEYWQSNIPLGRVIETDEIGHLAVFLLSDRASAITGANMFVDGGMTSQLVSRAPYVSKPITGEVK